MLIRKIEERDNADIATVIRSCFADFNAPTKGTVFEDPTTDDLYNVFKKEKSVLYIAEENGEIVGSCGIYPTENLPEDTAEMVKFYLTKNSRGKGTGRALMETALETARKMGYRKIYIESLPEFTKALSMYEKQGFKLLEKPLVNSCHTGCNIWMLKDIAE
ncbi:putative acetyltransferase [Chryseobacterium taklimakanense]|uniref:Putative acetyltransferase n=1 Tax=Chryseobacterium taklimakanense TaxID=536441 RepID=A0A239WA36_9FLAO|nr:GNAT family N-acetyltransferase [Chryseobacterium taklimakanense]SNV31371.1 putative acetyltransferase [Chryseobacterium taklimakanense]